MNPEGEPVYRAVATGAPPKKSRKTLYIVLFVVGAMFTFGIFMLVAAFQLAIDSTEKTPPSEADRLVVITTDALEPWMPDLVADPGLEVFTKSRSFDGSYEVEYEYDAADTDDGIYVWSTVTKEMRASDARMTYFAVAQGMKIGLAMGGEGVEMLDRPDLLTWGDESKSMLLMNGEDPAGNYFVARSGRFVFTLMLAGVYFDESEDFTEFLMPVLERLDGYEP